MTRGVQSEISEKVSRSPELRHNENLLHILNMPNATYKRRDGRWQSAVEIEEQLEGAAVEENCKKAKTVTTSKHQNGFHSPTEIYCAELVTGRIK